MKTRLEAITAHWEGLAKYYGGTNAKRFRTNLKRAATAASETANLFAGFEGEGRRLVDNDIETLRKAASLLSQLADDFEVAQRKADRAKATSDAQIKAKHQAQIAQVIKELFGDMPINKAIPMPSDNPVIAMAKDLAYFDRAGVDELAKSKGCDRGLLSNSYDTSHLNWCAERGQVQEAARIIAENRLSSCYPGRAYVDELRGTRWYHAGWDDFIAWRENHRKEEGPGQSGTLEQKPG